MSEITQISSSMVGQRILLGVTGGIAAYKSPDLVRRLRGAGADVRVVMTEGALAFVTPLTFQAVSGHRVHTKLLDEAAEAGMGHIELARWADRVVIAPATANFISRLAHGQAPDLLSTICLATTAPIDVAPAMNQAMWSNPATGDNVEIIIGRGVTIHGPGTGEQACGDEGPGRMLEPADIVAAISVGRPAHLAGKHVLVTAGPTFEDVDPVRFIGNRSSGKMGFAIAAAARSAGARVTLVAGPCSMSTPAGVERIDVRSAAQMLEAVMKHIAESDVYVGVAAVADYTPASVAEGKMKKGLPRQRMELVATRDIIAEVAGLENRPFTVGFAAETHGVAEYARDKLLRKGLDMIAANRVGSAGTGFASDENEILLLIAGSGKNGSEAIEERNLGSGSKTRLATLIIEEVAHQLKGRVGVEHDSDKDTRPATG